MRIFAAAAVAAGLLATPASAQAPDAATQDAIGWFKVCNRDQQAKKDFCVISRDLKSSSGQPLASVAIREVPGEQRKILLASIPVGMVIKPGVQLQVDGGDATKLDFTICFTNICYAELPTDQRLVTRLKGGRVMTLTAYNQQGKPVPFEMPLAGFTGAYDGPATDSVVIEEQMRAEQRRRDEDLEAQRARLIAEQRRAVEEAGRQ